VCSPPAPPPPASTNTGSQVLKGAHHLSYTKINLDNKTYVFNTSHDISIYALQQGVPTTPCPPSHYILKKPCLLYLLHPSFIGGGEEGRVRGRRAIWGKGRTWAGGGNPPPPGWEHIGPTRRHEGRDRQIKRQDWGGGSKKEC
jgi:hypothetical protein